MMIGAPPTRSAWAAKFRGVAAPALAGSALASPQDVRPEEAPGIIAAFGDESGHRRAVDRYVLSALLNAPLTEAPSTEPNTPADVLLWRRVAIGAPIDPVELVDPGEGPLTPEDPELAIEIWTETELAVVHAFRSLIDRAPDSSKPACVERLDAAVAWHTRTLQPDNATNHPWAVHVFAEAALAGNMDALLHAQGMLHACQVTGGQADRFSSCVLMHAACVIDSG